LSGTYFSYKGPGINNISRLIHPSPGDAVDHLSARLSLDVDGNVRFGPDIQQLGASDSDLDALEGESTPSSDRIASIGSTIQDYLPDIDPNLLTPESTEIQPNISSPKSGFSDFMFRHSSDRQGLVELLGFNSPGLTSSLAIGEYVAAMVRRDVWKAEGNVEALADGWE